MRILHIIPHYYPAVRYGGPIRSVHGLAAATAAFGEDVHVYTTNVDGIGVSDVPIAIPVERDGVKVWYFPAGIGRRVFRSPAMNRKLEDTVASFDILHIHYVWVWPTVAAAAAARRHAVPYVLAPRGMLVDDLIRRKSSIAKRMWLAAFEQRNIEAAAAIHVTAESEAAQVRALGLRCRRIAVIENGIDIPADVGVLTGAPSATTTMGRPNRPYILFLGRISWKKGIDRLVLAMTRIQSAELVVAGYDENGYRAVVEQLVGQAGIADRTRFVGPVEGEAKWSLIRGAHCLVLPSYNENFGMTVAEAMAVGCPVVVSEEVGLASVVRESGSGVVASGEPDQLAQAIKALIHATPDERRAISEAGRRTAAERFGLPTIARKMLALYRDCVGGLPPGAGIYPEREVG